MATQILCSLPPQENNSRDCTFKSLALEHCSCTVNLQNVQHVSIVLFTLEQHTQWNLWLIQ